MWKFTINRAYKIRGALNKIRSLSDEEKSKGVVCSSAGNHAQGVAFAASQANVKSTIVMPKTTPLLKIQSTKDLEGMLFYQVMFMMMLLMRLKELNRNKEPYLYIHLMILM